MAEEKKTLQYILIAVIATLVVTLATAGVNFWLLSTKSSVPKQKVIEPRPQLGTLEKMGDFLVNLADTEEARYVSTRIELEQNFGSHPEFGNEIGNRKSQLRDLIISVLSSKTSREMRTPEGKESLKQELKERINSVLAKGQIARVYFTGFAVQ
jgi:flagellar FliL protein